MAAREIICTVQSPADTPPAHQHIVEVGTEDRRWTVEQVYAAIDQGDSFYSMSDKVAVVRKYNCSHCGSPTLRTEPDDDDLDNNLDSLPRCG